MEKVWEASSKARGKFDITKLAGLHVLMVQLSGSEIAGEVREFQ